MVKRHLNVLMLGGAKRVSMGEQLIRAGRELGVEVAIFSHELGPDEPISSIGKIIVGSRYDAEDIDAELDRIIEENGIDVLLPFIDPAVEVAARCGSRNADLFVPVCSAELAHSMFDKAVAAILFERAGIAIPTTYTLEGIQYPAIFKPRTGSASKGIVIVHNAEEMSLVKQPIDSYLIQQYIAQGEEYTVDCYVGMADSEVKCAVPRLRIATAGGEVIRTRARRIPEVENMASEILKKLGFRGAVTLQFIYDRAADRWLLMEVNPRLGGGVICSILAGADIAKMIVEEAEGYNAAPCHDWRDNTLMTRYFREVMFYK